MEQKYIDRFFKKVSPEPMSGCWLWTGAITKDGHGYYNIGTKSISAHRFSAIIHNLNTTDPKKPVLRHACNVACCVNPNHLIPGTHAENCIDKVLFGNNGKQKLSVTDILSIRQKFATGISSKEELAIEYNITLGHVYNIIAKRLWKHI